MSGRNSYPAFGMRSPCSSAAMAWRPGPPNLTRRRRGRLPPGGNPGVGGAQVGLGAAPVLGRLAGLVAAPLVEFVRAGPDRFNRHGGRLGGGLRLLAGGPRTTGAGTGRQRRGSLRGRAEVCGEQCAVRLGQAVGQVQEGGDEFHQPTLLRVRRRSPTASGEGHAGRAERPGSVLCRVPSRREVGMLPDLAAAPDTDLPVRAVLPDVLSAVHAEGTAVLVAPPGSGKTTLVPLALADLVTGRVVVAQPRRIAARSAARRMAALVGEQVGGRVGYTVRGESRTGPDTRVEVVTTGVLVRRLQRDPDLPGTGAVLLDECHERHLDTDLALAFLVDVRATVRPDLPVLAASATLDADRIAGRLGAGAAVPVVRAASSAYPTEVLWCPPPRPVGPAAGARVDPRLLDHVAATVRRAVAEATGDVLVFLPGAAEIGAVANRLSGP